MLAIVLGRQAVREFDELITLFTKDSGQIELLAKGVKKILSKNSAHLEPGSVVDVEWVIGKQGLILTTVREVGSANFRTPTLFQLITTGQSLFLVAKITRLNDPDSRIFFLLHDWLVFLNQTSLQVSWWLSVFALKLLALTGVQPILNACVICQKNKEQFAHSSFAGVDLGFSIAQGGMVCQACSTHPAMSMSDVFTLEMWQHGSWRVVAETTLSNANFQPLAKLVDDFFVFHTGIKIPHNQLALPSISC